MRPETAHQFGPGNAKKGRTKSVVLSVSKSELSQQPSSEFRWVKELIDPTTCQIKKVESRFSNVGDSNGVFSDLIRT